ncbi:MAG TPA: SPOR domain-containing protein [Rhodanobacteraceae bacterium]
MARKGKQAIRNGGLPAWLLVLIGIVIGGVGVGIIMHLGHMPISRPDNTPQPVANSSSPANAGPGIAANPQSKKPRYDFYSVLPKNEVVIPDAQLNAQVKAEQQAGATTPKAASQGAASTNASQGQYLLQVGSFPKASDAQALKAKLALSGFRAEIQPVTINGQTWNRVRLGPYASATALEADRKRLLADGFHAIALKVRQTQ